MAAAAAKVKLQAEQQQHGHHHPAQPLHGGQDRLRTKRTKRIQATAMAVEGALAEEAGKGRKKQEAGKTRVCS
ncbi:hypothetical protein E2562_002924 [Oryza meyeriana var. granulata]|uniref:Uncharacterized protein n=1 Tax=Oryza meyeriana var. granulata TaxID=110450 RepID=A0A6G1DE69_9ORYZ|nr:hypothetical protein E2562_002924 [Oryza meyeriana var. granulata]